jgi:polyisoprenoid-binding protein YceI
MRRAILIIAGIAVVAVVGVVGWYFFIRDDPAELTLPDREGPQQSSTASELAGTWTSTDASVAGYRVREKLARLPAKSDAVGRTNAVTTQVVLVADGDELATSEATVDIDVTTLKSDSSQRDNAIQTRGLETGTFPSAVFNLTAPITVPQAALDGGRATVDATGDLTIHGVTKPVTIPIDVQLNEGRIEISGSYTFPFSDFGMDPPNTPVVSVEPDATLEFTLVLTKGP